MTYHLQSLVKRKIQAILDKSKIDIDNLKKIELCRHGDPSGNGDNSYECLICGKCQINDFKVENYECLKIN